MDTYLIGKLLKFVTHPVTEFFGNVFREKTLILGPSTSGKSTLIKILQNKPYYIGEYNHTQKIAIVDKKNIRYNTVDPDADTIKLKIKKDIPGEDYNIWEQVIKADRPKGIVLVVDLFGLVKIGLVKNGDLDIESDREFVNLNAKDDEENSIIQKITPKEKFQSQVHAFEVIYNAYYNNNLMLEGMSVFINKCDTWLKDGANELDIRYKYKQAIQNHIDLLKFSKDLQLHEDISWEVTCMDKDLKMKYLEPALMRYASKFQ